MKRTVKKLSISKETVRRLSGRDMEQVLGGMIDTFTNPVPSDACTSTLPGTGCPFACYPEPPPK